MNNKNTCLASLLCLFLYLSTSAFSATKSAVIPVDRLLTDDELVNYLSTGKNPEIKQIKTLYSQDKTKGLVALAQYFKAKYADRYLFDWRNVDRRFKDYKNNYVNARLEHERKKNIHLDLYLANTQWKLPFKNLEGRDVTAYELRHLARQHKVLDMAFMHLYEDRKADYIDYFVNQVRSLNTAFKHDAFETDAGGNGVFEVYRGGTRVIVWLQIHGFYLGSQDYDWRAQLDIIRTLLLEAAILNKKNTQYKKGNHQTRGMNALAMVSILFREYQGTKKWYTNAMDVLEQHLHREVNDDGFQFERSVHYHIDDIYNYFNAYQLARISRFPISNTWAKKLKSMFDVMVKMARPDKNLPVAGDDTDSPWAEYNEMDAVMLLGAILFGEAEFGYLASEIPSKNIFWRLRGKDFSAISSVPRKTPSLASSSLPDTGFYVMRDGWKEKDLYMNISAGLSARKPDHQHGDILGITAFGRGLELLPNYQVRYFLDDLEYFKNSFSKNVAIVDSIPQGIGWKSNRGGSGFGKWRSLPKPQVISWKTNEKWDYFSGTHDAYEKRGVQYFRKIVFFKGLGWMVKDVFQSSDQHEYQQIWQGHFSQESSKNHHRSVFSNGGGLEIIQLGDLADQYSTSIMRGKGNLIYSLSSKDASYSTFLYPFASFNKRLPQHFSTKKSLLINDWEITKADSEILSAKNMKSNATLSFSNNNLQVLFDVSLISFDGGELRFSEAVDLALIQVSSSEWSAELLNVRNIEQLHTTGLRLSHGKAIIKSPVNDVEPNQKFTVKY